MNIAKNKQELSVVIVTYNAGENIEKTLDSLIHQTHSDYEVVLVDGKSTDNTLEIIKKYQALFENKSIPVTCISERDAGIYDAMNKGIGLASGKWIYFLNVGDVLFDEKVLEDVLAHATENVDVIYGDVMDDYGFKVVRLVACPIEDIKWRMPFCHQAVFAKTEMLKDYLFNLNYSLSADYDQFLRIYLAGKNFKQIDRIISVYSREGISSQSGYLVLEQYKKIQLSHGIYGCRQRKEYYKRNIVGRLQSVKQQLLGRGKKLFRE